MIKHRASPAVIAAGVCVAAVITFQTWLASAGSWTDWPSTTQTYDQLASAFLRGQLALLEAPDPALLALENPYDPAGRRGVEFPLDVSLYKGSFYLYFGPVPALILAGAKAISGSVIGDEFLVFGFTAGLFLVLALLAFAIWNGSSLYVSVGGLGAGVLALGLAAPWGWLLTTANIYAAAVLGGAFFLAGGIYAAFRALDGKTIRLALLATAGALWACAVGSRITQALPVILLAGATAVELRRRATQKERPAAYLRSMAALIGPLAAGILILGWYNWARFGSVWESGIRYQLSGGFQEHMGALFTPAYAPQNLVNYLLAPPRLGYAFPYLKPTHGFREAVIGGYALPDIYWSSQITGLLITSPFILYSVVTAVRGIASRNSGEGKQESGVRWLTNALWLAFLSGSGLFLCFFWSAERYMADFVPAWFLLSVMGFWRLEAVLKRSVGGMLVHVSTAVVLLGTTMIAGNLLAMAFRADELRALNPVLWRQLGNIFRP